MREFRRRRLVLRLSLLVLAVCATVRIYFIFVPRGVSLEPYLLASVNGGEIISPNGTHYEVWFNDAGGAHSGNHWTWIVQDHIVFGRSVVTEGYLTSEFVVGADRKPFPVAWEGNRPVIEFADGRY